ncbi:MAG: CPBP family intramembrane metalloprotease [Bacteroidetes bacterium]|nr:CPBP family intramembrane metalloprotease [Bacteroidota bacterium]
MFNRYLRTYPWYFQLLMFVLMVFTLFSFVSLIAQALLPKITGYSISALVGINEQSPKTLVNASLLMQAIAHVGIFLFPSLLFAYLTHPRPGYYLGMRRPGKSIHWLLVIFIALGAIPVFMSMASLFQNLHWKWADEAQQRIDNLEKPYLNMSSMGDLLRVFTVMAILPALGEELFFRGIIMRFAKKRSRGMTFPILITSTMFALFHFTAYGFFPILFAGILLGLIYYLTGSIICSMLFHLLNNGLQIILMYAAKDNAQLKGLVDSNSLPIYLPILGLIVFGIAFYLLWKNRTPLPDNWASDFTEAELSEKAL